MGIETLQEITDRYSRMTIEHRMYSRARMRLSIKGCGRLSGSDSEESVGRLLCCKSSQQAGKELCTSGLRSSRSGPRMRRG